MEIANPSLEIQDNKSSFFEKVLEKVSQLLFQNPPHQDTKTIQETPLETPSVKNPVTETKSLPVTSAGKLAREERKATYQAEKDKFQEEPTKIPEPIEPIIQVIDNPLVTKTVDLPSDFESVIKSDQTLNLTPEDLPWLKEAATIPLAKITLKEDTHIAFLYGSCIKGKALVDAANKLSPHQSNLANQILYARLPVFIRDGYSSHVKLVDNHITPDLSYYVGNPGGQRVYFMKFNVGNIPAIIRIAACDKAQQGEVMSVLTFRDRKYSKKVGKL